MENKKKISMMNLLLITMLILCLAISGIVIVLSKLETSVKLTEKSIVKIDKTYTAEKIKTWDVSEEGNGSVTAVLDANKNLTISGIGRMKDWNHNNQEVAEWYSIIEDINNVVIEEGVTYIGNRAFSGCKNIKYINFPTTIEEIGIYAFSSCESLTTIEINSYIEPQFTAFQNLTNLKKLVIGKEVEEIKTYFFTCLEYLETIEINEQNTAFSVVENILYDKNVTKLIGCARQKAGRISIPTTVTEIRAGAFQSCANITTVKIPNGVTNIGNYTFNNCKNLISIEMSSSVTSIGKSAFNNCTNLTSIEIPKSVTSIGDDAFNKCTSLTSIEVDENNGKYCDENGVLYTKDKKKIIRYPEGKMGTTYTIINGVTSIGNYAFLNCTSLINIEIPSSVTSIGSHAFSNCSNLKSLKIPNSITQIYYSGIYNCSNLTITCKSGTRAETYSIENNINYQLDDVVPNVEIAGNWTTNPTTSVQAKINVKDELSGVEETSLKYVWSEESQNITKEQITEEFRNRETIELKEVTGTYYLWIYAIDKVGNEAIEKKGPVYLDNTSPTIKVNNIITTPVKSVQTEINVTDEISGVEETSLKYLWSTESENITKGQITEEFTNGETIELKEVTGIYYLWIYAVDKLGNEAIEKKGPFQLDNIAPTINVSYSTTTATNQNVTVTITANETVQEVEGWMLSLNGQELTKEYTSNTVVEGENIIVKDLVGNESTVNVNVLNIDKERPTINLSYSITTATNQNVTVIITANETVQEVEGWTLSSNGQELTKEYTSNTVVEGEDIIVKDLAGNESTVNVKVLNIDKESPAINLNYSTTTATNQNVTVKITSDETVQEVEGWILSSNGKELTKEYTSNTVLEGENITVKDLVGNESNVNVKVLNIDKERPTINISYSTTNVTNQNVTVTIKGNEELQGITGWILSSNGQVLTKEYTSNTVVEGEDIIVKDLAGNESTVNVKILNIDKECPTANINYSTTNATNQNVKVTIKGNEELQGIAGWTKSSNGKELTKEYTSNTVVAGENITIKDLAGNKSTVNVKILNIDKELPTIEINTEITSTTIKVEATASDTGSGINESTCKYYIKEENGTYGEGIADGNAHTFTNLKTEQKYYIKVEVTDNAGNKTNKEVQVITKKSNKLTTTTYRINEEKLMIKEIQPKTTAGEIKNKIQGEMEFKIINAKGETVSNTSKVATGYKIKLEDNKEYTLVVTGDSNGDGETNIKDILAINKHRLNKAELVDEYLIAGDVNGDGKADIKDILQINKFRLGKISVL